MSRLYQELDVVKLLRAVRGSKILQKTIFSLRQRVLLQL
jgi:hypothetical protein